MQTSKLLIDSTSSSELEDSSSSSRPLSQRSSTGANGTDDFLYIVTSGRTSSRKHIAKLRFVPWGSNNNEEKVCVLVDLTLRKPDWIQNVPHDGTKQQCILGSRVIYGRIVNIKLPQEPSREEDALIKQKAIDLFREKYTDGTWNTSDLTRFAPVIIEFKEGFGSRRQSVSELEFDFQARRYTSYVLTNDISRWLREVTISLLLQYHGKGDTLLEIGAGTGIETIELAKRGVRVLAIDISKEMLSILSARATRAHVEDLIETRLLSSSDISELASDKSFPEKGFDGVFSDFGAVNLEPNLARLSENIRRLLVKKDAIATFAVWNRLCLSDLLLQAVKRDVSLARERLSGRVRATSDSRYSLDTFAYSPMEFASFFAEDFQVKSIFALPTMIPPYQYNRWAGPLLKFKKADLAIGRLPVLRDIGDSFVLTMRAK